MKVLIRQFLGKNHSWSCCGWGIATALITQGHQVDLFSTDGVKHLPENLRPHLIGYVEENGNQVFGKLPDGEYDAQISYTALKNFPHYLSNGNQKRIGIWCYEWFGKNVLPTGFAKQHKACDWLCAPSNQSKIIFMDSGIPEDKIRVVPHGIHVNSYRQTATMILPTKKQFKLLANIAQNHLRKNIPGLLEAYGKAFTNKDDVCLILKAKDKPVTFPFEVSISACLKDFNQKYPHHAEVKMISDFIDDMSALYRSIDCVYTMTFGEGFYFPGLEGIAAGKMSIAPDQGGQIDFLKCHENAFLVSGKEERANPKSMYWEPKVNASWYRPNIDHAVEQLRSAYQNHESFNQRVAGQQAEVLVKYDWKEITRQLVE